MALGSTSAWAGPARLAGRWMLDTGRVRGGCPRSAGVWQEVSSGQEARSAWPSWTLGLGVERTRQERQGRCGMRAADGCSTACRQLGRRVRHGVRRCGMRAGTSARALGWSWVAACGRRSAGGAAGARQAVRQCPHGCSRGVRGRRGLRGCSRGIGQLGRDAGRACGNLGHLGLAGRWWLRPCPVLQAGRGTRCGRRLACGLAGRCWLRQASRSSVAWPGARPGSSAWP